MADFSQGKFFGMAKSHDETRIGGATVARDFGTPKKPYSAPAFERIDINTARAALEAEGASKAVDSQQMSAVIEERWQRNRRSIRHGALRLGRVSYGDGAAGRYATGAHETPEHQVESCHARMVLPGLRPHLRSCQ